MTTTNPIGAVLAVVASFAFVPGAFAQSFDLVISNGRVMDPETGFDQIANVGIDNGYITEISTDDLEGARVIDATCHVVAPGFIDFHTHGQDPFSIKVGLRDGVTTPLDMEAGAYPVDAYFDGRAGALQASYGVSVGHVVARLATLDKVDSPGGSLN